MSSVTKGKENFFYTCLMVIMSVTFVFFFSTKSFMYDSTRAMQTEFQTEISGLSQTDVVLERWEYNPSTSTMEVVVNTSFKGVDPLRPSYAFRAKERDGMEDLPLKVIYSGEDFHVIHIYDIPEKYRVIGLFMKEMRHPKLLVDGEEDETSEILLTGDYRKVEINEELTAKTSYEYIIERIDAEMERLQSQIDQLEAIDLPLQDEIKAALILEIDEMEADMQYQTEQEKQVTLTDIANKQRQVESAEGTKDELMDDIELKKEKIEHLKKKRADMEEKQDGANSD